VAEKVHFFGVRTDSLPLENQVNIEKGIDLEEGEKVLQKGSTKTKRNEREMLATGD
jgi:hypothetical protein